jgi:ABC-type glycerol-3-phosphate transport system substrate-binding protein
MNLKKLLALALALVMMLSLAACGAKTETTETETEEAEETVTPAVVGAVFCGGQGGDQGTRALVNNLYGGTFTNADHTAYTWDEEANVQALQTLYDLDGIAYDPSIVGGDEIALFYNGTLKMAFCWNIAQQLNPNSADTGAGLTANGDEIVFMSFPSETGESQLCGGIWGFGVFDNGDASRIAAAKEFIKYMCDSENTIEAVQAANYFAVRDTAEGTDLTGIWADNDIMNEYTVLMPYLGDYYQVTSGWAEARTAWWNMLQEVGTGADVATAVANYAAQANDAADAANATGDETTEHVATDTTDATPADSITLWTYPIGNWGDEETVKALTDAFTAETGISVTVEYLTYTDGDDKVNTALAAGQAPDLIMEGPERLVANWGANGYMVDLSDMLDDEDLSEIYDSVLAACINDEGACYEYPLVMTAHCMAINYTAFQEAGADQYVDIETHTWTTEDFINAVNTLSAYYAG